MLFRNTPLLSYSFCFVWFSLDWPKHSPKKMPNKITKKQHNPPTLFIKRIDFLFLCNLQDILLSYGRCPFLNDLICFIHPFVNQRKRSEATRKSRLMTGVVPLPDQSMLILVTRILLSLSIFWLQNKVVGGNGKVRTRW